MAHGLDGVGVEQDLVGPGDGPISATGWIVPISLLAAMMEMRRVSGRIAASTAAGSTRPCPSTGR